MNQTQKKALAAINVVAAWGFVALSTWKGPHVAGIVYAAIAVVCMLVGALIALHIIPASVEAYVDALEGAVVEHAPPETIAKLGLDDKEAKK